MKTPDQKALLDQLAARAERALDLSRQTLAGSRVDSQELAQVLDTARRDLWLRQGLPDRRSRVRAPGEPMPPGARKIPPGGEPQL